MKAVIAVCLGVTLLAPAAHSAVQDSGLPAAPRDQAVQSQGAGNGCGPYGACDRFSRIAQATPTKPTPHGGTATDGWINPVGGENNSGGKTPPKSITTSDDWLNPGGGTGGNGGKTPHKGVTTNDDWENTSGTAASGLPTGKRQH